jgi:hypothetical protein
LQHRFATEGGTPNDESELVEVDFQQYITQHWASKRNCFENRISEAKKRSAIKKREEIKSNANDKVHTMR